MISNSIYFAGYKFMSSMAKATYSPDGALIDGGIDLNDSQGMAEYVSSSLLFFFIWDFEVPKVAVL